MQVAPQLIVQRHIKGKIDPHRQDKGTAIAPLGLQLFDRADFLKHHLTLCRRLREQQNKEITPL